jgi:hypothetical protein
LISEFQKRETSETILFTTVVSSFSLIAYLLRVGRAQTESHKTDAQVASVMRFVCEDRTAQATNKGCNIYQTIMDRDCIA